MNYDLKLVSSVLETRDITVPIKLGVRSAMLGDEAQTYWDILLEHYEQFHEVPSPEFFHGMCPSYEHVVPNDTVEAIVGEVKTRYLHSSIEGALLRVAEMNGADPWAAKNEFVKLADSINVEVQRGNSDLIAGEDKAAVFKTLDDLQRNDGLLGYPWPWEYLNQNSMGLVPGNFWYIYGREKSKKTFILLYLALFFESLGLRVLFITREMTLEEIAWRLYPMRAGIAYTDMTKGKISSDGRVTLEQAMDALYTSKNLIVSEVFGGIAGVRAKIEEIKPHVVIHDYMKAIADDEMGDRFNVKEHQYVARVADMVKNIAKNPMNRVLFIGCGHANREGEKGKGKSTTELGHSDHIARRADGTIRIISDDVRNWIALIINAGRGVQKFLSWTIDGSLDHNFGNFIDSNTSWVDSTDSMDNAEDEARDDAPDVESVLKKIRGGFKRGA